MSDFDSEDECPWDWLRQQIASESSKTEDPIPKQIVRPEKNVDLRRNHEDKNIVNTKKYSGSKPKLSSSITLAEHTPATRDLTEEEIKKIKLSEELKEIKVKLERAKANREKLKQIYEERNKSDPHKNKRHLSFNDLRREYVG